MRHSKVKRGVTAIAVLAAALARMGRVEEAHAAYEELERQVPGVDVEALASLVEEMAPSAESARAMADALRQAARG